MRDVIVVGAGPAGCSVAHDLAERGHEVAVYEKRQEIGAPKRCAEGFSSESIKRLDLNVPEDCKRNSIDGAKVYAPDKKNEVRIQFDENVGCVLERKLFDKWMAKRAASAGAKIRAKTRITDLLPENKGVKGIKNGEKFEEKAKMVVAADGIESLIAREAGIKGTPNAELIDSGYQYEMTNLDLKMKNKIFLYFGNEIAPRGYIWVFPKGENTANVGIGIIPGAEKSAKRYLDEFIEKNDWLNKGSILEVNSGAIPVGDLLEDMVAENSLAVGDAANQVNPIHGGGISEGIEGGQIAAKVIDEALQKKNTSKEFLTKYNDLWWERRGKKLKKVEKIREVMERLSDKDMNFLAQELTGKDLMNFSRGENLSKLKKSLLKRPGLMKLARNLM